MKEIVEILRLWFSDSLRQFGMHFLFSVLLIFLAVSFRKIIMNIIFRKKDIKADRIRRWRKNINYTVLVILLLILFPIWLPSIQNLLPVLGIFGAGVIVVLKEVILNIAGWFYIVVRRPFEEGNRIGIAGIIGDVIDVRLQQFSMMEVKSREDGGQSTGRVLHIPNSLIFSSTLANSSKEFSFNWNEIKIPLTPDSDWEKAVKIVKEVAEASLETITETDFRIQKAEKEYAIHFHKLTPGVYVEFKDGSILITLRHLAEPRKTRQITDHIWRMIFKRFSLEEKVSLN